MGSCTVTRSTESHPSTGVARGRDRAGRRGAADPVVREVGLLVHDREEEDLLRRLAPLGELEQTGQVERFALADRLDPEARRGLVQHAPPRQDRERDRGATRPDDVPPLAEVAVDQVADGEPRVGPHRPPEHVGPRDRAVAGPDDLRPRHLGEVDRLVPVECQGPARLGRAKEALSVEVGRLGRVLKADGRVVPEPTGHGRALRSSPRVASGSRRTPIAESRSRAPASRSMTTSARSTRPPAARMISTERTELPPVVETSSIKRIRWPAPISPSKAWRVPCSFAALRRTTYGWPVRNAVATTRGTAPSSMPASRSVVPTRAARACASRSRRWGSVHARFTST